MNIQTFYPQNSILKKHIEYYYILKTNSDDFTSTYYAFPKYPFSQVHSINKEMPLIAGLPVMW